MKLIREKRWPIFELRFHCFVWWGGLAKTTNTKITNLLKIKRVMPEFQPPSHPNPTTPKCKKLKIDLLNKKNKIT
jgi:hypothetical protein